MNRSEHLIIGATDRFTAGLAGVGGSQTFPAHGVIDLTADDLMMSILQVHKGRAGIGDRFPSAGVRCRCWTKRVLVRSVLMVRSCS